MFMITPLFPTLLQTLNYNPPKDLIDHINQYYQQYKYRGKQRSSRLGWQSKPHNIQQLQPIYQHIHDNVDINLTLNDAWININYQGAYNITHIHPNTDYTFVYYPYDHNTLLVLDCPNMYTQHNHLHYQSNYTKQQYNLSLEHKIQPSKGMLLMFPSYVPHRVEVNTLPQDRISLSWSANCTP
ncbi:hypothetical protein N231010_069 [Synechococcus phage S-CAM4]|uniref:2OG-Fe(II) oxygenase n=3 Tax=Potamoivirus TaxID=2948872 RepID=A0A1D8KM88_9CAUD|nr:hypothetical protein N231010_069 [Synechococcus phage S-CAM4]